MQHHKLNRKLIIFILQISYFIRLSEVESNQSDKKEMHLTVLRKTNKNIHANIRKALNGKMTVLILNDVISSCVRSSNKCQRPVYPPFNSLLILLSTFI